MQCAVTGIDVTYEDAAQVGTRDGRVKIFGSDGVECTFRSPFQTATKQLQFLENKGALLRLTTVSHHPHFSRWLSVCSLKYISVMKACNALQDGDVQLWGVEAGGFVDSLSNAEEDTITTACPLYDEPYVLLGCQSGKMHAASLLGSSGSPAGGAREACSLSKLSYEGDDLTSCEQAEYLASWRIERAAKMRSPKCKHALFWDVAHSA